MLQRASRPRYPRPAARGRNVRPRRSLPAQRMRMRYPLSKPIRRTQQKSGFSKLLAVLMKILCFCIKHRQQQQRRSPGTVKINLGGGGGGGGFGSGFGNAMGNILGNEIFGSGGGGGGGGGGDPFGILAGGDPLGIGGGGGGGGGGDPFAIFGGDILGGGGGGDILGGGGGDIFGGGDFMPNPAARNQITNYDNRGKY